MNQSSRGTLAQFLCPRRFDSELCGIRLSNGAATNSLQHWVCSGPCRLCQPMRGKSLTCRKSWIS